MNIIANNNYVNLNTYSKKKENRKSEILTDFVQSKEAGISSKLSFTSLQANFLTRPNISFDSRKKYSVSNCSVLAFKANQANLLNELISSKGGIQGLEENPTGIYEFIKQKETTPEQTREYLDKVLQNDKLRNGFIKEITNNPRESAQIIGTLEDKLGGEDNFRDWYFGKEGYCESFGKYIGDFQPQANTVEELLTLKPNWKLSDIVGTYHKSITGDVFQGDDPKIGALPLEFGGKYNDFPQLVHSLREQPWDGNGEIYTDSGKQFGFNVLKQSDEKIICKVTPRETNKDYVIKIDKMHDDYMFTRLRANSVYLESMMGYYLSRHDCKNVPKFHYYDFYNNAALFDFKHGEDLSEQLNPIKMNQLTPDLLALGIRTNDIHMSNLKQADGKWFNLDLGNASYFDGLKPGDLAHTIYFPNYAGLNFSDAYNTTNFAKFIRESQKNTASL